MSDDIEVPFPADPECLLTWDDDWPDDAVGWITFIDPKLLADAQALRAHLRTSIPVTRKPGGYDENTGRYPTLGNVWEFERPEPGVLITKPSIHAVDMWHSPNPTRWRIVERLSDEAAAE